MNLYQNWRRFVASVFLLLLMVTACQANESVVTPKVELPTAAVSRQSMLNTPTPQVERGTPVDQTPTPPTAQPADPASTSLLFGLKMEASSFKGAPNAPVVIVEFSDYQ